MNHYDGDMESPNDMMVDPADYVDQEDLDEKDDVAIINPDQLGIDGDLPEKLRADNFEAMKELVFTPTLEQPPILAEAVHTWQIENWRSLPRREHGPVFEAGGQPWRVLMFPSGNNSESVSVYLEQGFEDGKVPEDWVCCVHFSLVLWNPNDPTILTHNTAHHRFTKEEGDWGFTRFVDLRRLWGPWDANISRRPLIEGEAANLTAYVRVVKDETGVLWHNFQNYDSKKETGYVGLKNQGATCYLNSLIQSLYFTNAFRKAIYQIPTQNEETLTNSAYTLQRLFYQLQTSNAAVSTNELTKSFGWETRHIFEQQDVQELSRKLMERMEEKMKGTPEENFLSKLFSGNVRTYISCINVDYESRRVEPFWDVQLNVSGNKDIESSFKDYIQVEIMNGENQYFASEEYKLQDAKKGVIFESFPDVLHLQLKRFQYDIEHDTMMKINDRYEFPESFDAAPYLSEEADKSESYVYQLHGVLVHSGDLNAGHYYAFIKPTADGWFYRYDDDRVTKATMREVLEDNYGGEYLQPNGERYTTTKGKPLIRQNSAYMLVYIRQTRVGQVLLPVSQEDTPPHLQKKLDEEAAEREARRKEREESHLYLSVRVITDDTFRAYGGTDLTVFDLKHDVDPSAARSYRSLRKMTLKDFATTVAEDLGCDARRIRFWCMVNRQNKTVRPDAAIVEVNATLEEIHLKLSGNKQQELRLWAELAEDVTPEGDAIWPTIQNVHSTIMAMPKTDLIVLFLKHFDVEKQALAGAGHIYISREKKVEDLVPAILKKMQWPEKLPNGDRLQLKLWEEIKPDMVEPMKAKQSLKAAELQDGDIVCFQKASDKDSKSSATDQSALTKNVDRIDDARNFYDFLLHKRIVRFHPHPRNGNPELKAAHPEAVETFNLVLSSMHTYDQLAARVGERLAVNPTHLRFWTVNISNGAVKNSVRRNQGQILHNILAPQYSTFSNSGPRSDALYFEVLEMSLSELDTKKPLKVVWLSEGITKEDHYELLVPKSGNANDIITALIKKGRLDDEAKAGPIRVYEVHNNKIYKELPREHAVLSINEYITLFAERIPEEDLLEPPDEVEFIHAFHFQNEPAKTHGVPFAFRLIKDEKFVDTKKRLEKRTGMKGKNFEKIKFTVVKRSSYSKPTYLTDDDILYEVASHNDDLLGLDHVDRTRAIRNGAGDLFLR